MSPRSTTARLVLTVLAAALAACQATPVGSSYDRPRAQTLAVSPDVALTQPPYHQVHIDWKQRVEQPYVYLELTGDYRQAGRWIGLLIEHASTQGLAVNGAPFALFYDDPARVPTDRLRSRVGLPVAAQAAVAAPLGADVLPAANVVYARVAGAYPEVQRSHGGLFAHLAERGWALDGPVREIYLVNPSTARGPEDLVSEVQVPWRVLF